MFALRVAALVSLAALVAAAPLPWDGGDAYVACCMSSCRLLTLCSYTGVGGQAIGGSVHGGGEGHGPLGLGPIKALNFNSGNAGHGGAADSGTAVGGKGGDK
jgi:hypothetical protein